MSIVTHRHCEDRKLHTRRIYIAGCETLEISNATIIPQTTTSFFKRHVYERKVYSFTTLSACTCQLILKY